MSKIIRNKATIFVLFYLIFGFQAIATHIAGAEINYECLGGDNYQIRLRIYRDCSKDGTPDPNADFDPNILLFIYKGSNLYTTVNIAQPAPITVATNTLAACFSNPPVLCYHYVEYSAVVNLPASSQTYHIGWARCCRNHIIDNLFNPGEQGVTFYTSIPPSASAVCNSSPRFSQTPPIFLCAGQTFQFNFSATDKDGDSLVYAITPPYTGLNTAGQGAGVPTLGQPSPITDQFNPLGLPPYQNVTYNSGFSSTIPFGASSSASIDPNSGLLTITPNLLGTFTIAVSVYEYRNGVLLSENKFDHQFTVTNCIPPDPPPVITHDLTGNTVLSGATGDTIVISANNNFCYDVNISDSSGSTNLVGEIVSQIPSGLTVNATPGNPLILQLCWTADCDDIGTTFPLIVKARDLGDCPLYNNVFDTVYIKVEPAGVSNVQIVKNFGGLTTSNDTVYLEYSDTVCFDFTVSDTSSLAKVQYQVNLVGNTSGVNLPTVNLITQTDSLVSGQICWNANCNALPAPVGLEIIGTDTSQCPPYPVQRDTTWLVVNPPPNPAPILSTDLSGNALNADTILIQVHDTTCFSFTVQDTSGLSSNTISQNVTLKRLSGTTVSNNFNITQSGTADSIVYNLCWTPNCDFVDETFIIEIEGILQNDCDQNSVLDSVFVQISDRNNPAPQISHQFIPTYTNINDTLIVNGTEETCYNFTLLDSIPPVHLTANPQVYYLNGTPYSANLNVSFSQNTDSLISGTICWTPGCDLLNEKMMIVLTGIDTFDCYPTQYVYDTVFVDVTIPVNNPPSITHTILENIIDMNTLYAEVGEKVCYQIQVTDPDLNPILSLNGTSEQFDPNFSYGGNAVLTYIGTNPINAEVCITPNCYNKEDQYVLKVCVVDSNICGQFTEICDSVVLEVRGCKIEFPNVFSPNNDGYNDTFFPINMEGVKSYKMSIFDRWGRQVFYPTDGQAWNGNFNGNQVPEGTYYYVIEYEYFSGTGPVLSDVKQGYITLLR